MTTTTLTECERRVCSYHTHYLAYSQPGEPDLGHDAFHAAEARCTEAQVALADWMDQHADLDPLADGRGAWLWRRAEQWEAKVRA